MNASPGQSAVHPSEEGISPLDQMRELRIEFRREQDSVKREEVFDRFFLLIAARWRQLLAFAADEGDPEQFRAIITEMDAILRERSAGVAAFFEFDTASSVKQRPERPASAKVLHKIAASSK